MSRRLEVLDRTPLPAEAFAERVMAAIRQEPPPTPTRAFVSALRARTPRDAGSALWAAWHLGTVRRWSIAPRVRARSIALVLAVTCALGTGSLATAAAVRVAAEPVVQLFQSGMDEHGPVENHPLGIDEQGPVKQQPAGDGTQHDSGADDRSQSEGAAPEGNAAGSDQPRGGGADNDESGADEADDEDADTNDPDVDEANDDEAGETDQFDPDDATVETGEDSESDTDEPEAAEDASASDEHDADQPDSDDDPNGTEDADDGEGGDSAP